MSIYVLAISLSTFAFVHGKYGLAAVMLALPTTAVLSILVFGERADRVEMGWVALAFLGVAVALGAVKAGPQPAALPIACAALATVFMSFGLLGQKRQGSHLNNVEVTALMLLSAGLVLLPIVLGHALWTGNMPRLSTYGLGVGVGAGLANVVFLLASNYGMPRLPGLVANNVLALQPVFGVAVGLWVYGEALTAAEGAGCLLVAAALVGVAVRRGRRIGAKGRAA